MTKRRSSSPPHWRMRALAIAALRVIRVGDESPSDAEVVSGVSPGDTVLLIAGTNMAQDSVALRARRLLFALDSTRH